MKNDNINNLIYYWVRDVNIRARLHSALSQRKRRSVMLLSMTTLCCASFFVTVQIFPFSTSDYFYKITSTLSAILLLICILLRDLSRIEDRVVRHTIAADMYARLKRDLDLYIATQESEIRIDDFKLSEIKQRIQEIESIAPSISSHIHISTTQPDANYITGTDSGSGKNP